MCEKKNNNCILCISVLMFLVMCANATAQQVTGNISGTVVDTTNKVIPNTTITLVNEGTGEEKNTSSNDDGFFTFLALEPGTYTVKATRQGFRGFERKGVVLTANERLSVGNMQLQVGEVTETVTVTDDGSQVQVSSSDRTELLSGKQLDLTQVRSRDVVSLLRLLPGVSYQPDAGGTFNSESLGGTFGTFTPNISGTRSQWNNFTLDGQSGNDADITNAFNGTTSLDAIAEVKVLPNNYQAEYGRNLGATVNIISKAGTRDFHGSLYWYKRHEKLNANDFFNNRNNQVRPIYRYNTFGGTVGGPVFIPKLFNENRDKLFFFYSREDWRVREPRSVRRVTVPTARERAGDFSQTLDLNGRLISIRDPLTGQPFPGNIIPTNRINSNGQALLSLFPQPNALDRGVTAGNYNYQFQEITEIPKKQNLLRLDYNPTTKDNFSVRGRTWWSDRRGYEALAAFNSNFDHIPHHYLFTEDSIQGNYTRIFSPTVVNEFSISRRLLGEDGALVSGSDFDAAVRAKRGITLGQFDPSINALNLVPQISFGGVPSAANISYDGRTPINAGDARTTLSDNLTWSKGTHTFKFGLFVEKNVASEGPRTNFGGNFNFGVDSNNPGNTNYAYANALLGNFTTYSEGSRLTTGRGKLSLVEWFAQDTWKATRRLTLDLGLRFSRYTFWQLRDKEGASFFIDRYDRSRAPLLFRPALNASGGRVAQNPLTGELRPAVFIGAYVPGTGDPVNGMALATDPEFEAGFIKQQPVQLGPRIGFAYDVFGDGRTALRGGFGITKQTTPSSGQYLGGPTFNPPLQFNPTVFYGNLNDFLGSAGVLFPNNVTGFERDPKTPSVYNYSLGVQRAIGSKTVVEVSYVGNVARHLIQSRNLNTVPYGARFRPENIDPTDPNRTRALPDNFFRPFPGYQNVTYIENSGTSNYNSFQATAERRFTQGLQFSAAYTWSKAMDLTDGDGGGLPLYRPYRTWLYGRAGFDQTHVLVFNYTWDLPRLSNRWNNPVVHHLFDDWQLSGITAFTSGTPLGFGFSTTDNADITGGGDGVRVNLISNPILPRSERSFDRWFDTAAFARPGRGDFGSAPKDVLRGPGVNNWDVTVFKKFPLKGEERYFQLRWEIYNIFNHTQFFRVDTGARFDTSGRQVNSNFGRVTETRTPRIMQVALRFAF
ncbi:MAG: TonB-dependent receptor [Pyrinomonadaceae bacterium]|nr:TonB-dependent receptor [Pyrinomonadaceae bacterium]